MRCAADDLLGREAELGAVRGLLCRYRVVTVTGVGGVGKTRLALAAAAGESERRVDVCELGAVDEPAAVPFAVADALGFPSLDAACVAQGAGERLLVLDDCEHVLDAAADTAVRLVERCPGVVVLATSREALGVPGEHVLEVAPLALPAGDGIADAAGSPAVRLLLARAAAGGARLDLAADLAAVVALCRRLDGLPLAIELAAARLRSLTPHEVLAHVDHRLGLLSRHRNRGPERHRSLEAAIGWSYERLPTPTRRFFECLAVFSGRFTARHAHDVAAVPGEDLVDTVQRLDQLVTQSLVTVEQQEGRTWYGLLHTLRGFAHARLVERGDARAARDRWVDSIVATAVDSRGRMLRAWPPDLFVTLQNMHGDVAEALRWCVAHDTTPDRAMPLFIPMCSLLKRRSAMPVAELGDLVLGRWPQPRHEGWAEVAAAASVAHVLRGSGERGVALARRAIAGSPSALAGINARRAMYFHERMAGRDEAALRWVEEAIELAAAHGMEPWRNELLTFRAVALASLGRTREAIEQVEAAYQAAPAIGSPALEAGAASIRACLVALRDPVAGRAMCERAARHCEAVDYPLGAGFSLRALGALSLVAGEHGRAAGYLGRALDAYLGIGYAFETALTLRWVARLAHAAGRQPAAAALWRSAGSAGGDIIDRLLDRLDLDRELAAASDGPAPPPHDAMTLARAELTEIALPASGGPSPDGADPGVNRFQLDGAVWSLSFAARTVRLPDTKGLRDLAVLLARPGREVHCTELMGAAVEQPDTGPVLDAVARRAYQAKVVELRNELAEAVELGDLGRTEKIRTEMELLLAELAGAGGIHGRARCAGGNTERVRSAVTHRIRGALRRIDELHPALGHHLGAAVHTGTWCVYRPDVTVRWSL